MGRKVQIKAIGQKELLEKRAEGGVESGPGEEVHGWYSPMESTVYIHSGLDTECFRRVLLHELAHATFSFSGLTHLLQDSKEEAICDVLENWLSLFQDRRFVESLRD